MKNKKMVNVYISRVENSNSFNEKSNELSELLTSIEELDKSQLERLILVYKNNNEVNGSYGFNGIKSYLVLVRD